MNCETLLKELNKCSSIIIMGDIGNNCQIIVIEKSLLKQSKLYPELLKIEGFKKFIGTENDR